MSTFQYTGGYTSCGTCVGITNGDGDVFRWGGHAFNPTGNPACGYQGWDPYAWTDVGHWDGHTGEGPQMYQPKTVFAAAGMQAGHELVCFCAHVNIIGAGSWWFDMTWVLPDGSTLGPYRTSGSGQQEYCSWRGIGLRDLGAREIYGNSAGYYMLMQFSDGQSHSFYFEVTGIDTNIFLKHEQGYIWVEGNNLCFTGSNQGYKHIIAYDTTYSGAFVGTGSSGYVWISSTTGDYHIYYVDSSGYIRRTKKGDIYGVANVSAQDVLPSNPGASCAGYIWVSGGDNNWDTYLMAIASDGNKFRVGVGDIESGDNQ